MWEIMSHLLVGGWREGGGLIGERKEENSLLCPAQKDLVQCAGGKEQRWGRKKPE